MRILRWSGAVLGLVGAGGFVLARPLAPADCGCEVVQDPAPVPTVQPGAHDPTVVKEGKSYYLFMTGKGIPTRSSTDLKTWSPVTSVFPTTPEWAPKTIEGFKDVIWAPDVTYFGGKWHLYYAISTFGKNRSAIGLATTPTLDPSRKDFKWLDEGPVFQSYATDGYNAIDPNVVPDEHGKPWMEFGSYWTGLKIVPLDESGHLMPGVKPVAIAQRPEAPDALEAGFIVRRGGFYYLFASYDFCCRGVKSDYNVRVGRSKDVQGPYLDAAGKPMLDGGGTKVIESGPRWKGTGGQAILRDGRTDYLVYHAYDTQNNGRPYLQIAKISWKDGWPTVPASL